MYNISISYNRHIYNTTCRPTITLGVEQYCLLVQARNGNRHGGILMFITNGFV